MTQFRPLRSIAASLITILAAAPVGAQGTGTLDRDKPPPIAGRVLDAAGQPSAETWVYLVRRTHPELPADFEACLGDEPYHTEIAVTDARGRFRIVPDGYWPMAMYARSKAGAMAPLRFPVLPGDFTQLELRSAAKIHGQVLHAGTRDRPAQGQAVEIRVTPALPEENALWGFEVARLLPFVRFHTRTDGLGRFELSVPTESPAHVGVRSADTMLWGHDPSEITLPPPQPFMLSLRSGGRPVPAARAYDLSLPARPRLADERGNAVLPNLGSSPILVLGPNHQPRLLDPTDIDLPVPMKKGHRLQGRFVRRHGTPLANARLVFARPFSQGPQQTRWQFAAWAERADGDGRFDLGWVERGVPLLGYVEIDGRFNCFLLRVPDGPLDLGDVTVTASLQIRGDVSAPDRTPAAGAWVFFRPTLPADEGDLEHAAVKLSLSQVLMTGRGGRFLVDRLLPGSYELIVRQRGCRPFETAVIAATEAVAMPIKLQPAPSVRGVVVDGTGAPVVGCNVTLMQNSRQFRGAARRFGDPPVHLNTRTSKDGTFEFTDVPSDIEFDLRAYGNHAGKLRQARLAKISLDGEPVRLIVE